MRGFDHALDEIHAGLGQSDSWRRWEAINALSRVWNSESAAALEQILTSGTDRERQETVMSLGKIADEKAAELLIRALDDPRPGVRWRACMGLVRIRDVRARSPLERLLATDTDEDVLRFAQQALDALPRAAPATDESPDDPEGGEKPDEAGPGDEE
jgi:HEAT repeat protein